MKKIHEYSIFEFRCIVLFAAIGVYFLSPTKNEMDYIIKVWVCIGAVILGFIFSKQFLRGYEAYHNFMDRLIGVIFDKIFKYKEDKTNEE